MGRFALSLMFILFLSIGAMSIAHAQAMLPWANADQVIQQQQNYNSQQQRLSPRNRVFLAPTYYRQDPQNPTQYYDAMTINKYLMGYPSTDYRVRPLVKQPMYNRPGTGDTIK
ncbi:MAG: hypothetical protein COV45_06715 [Deltaproteobacteria bacterium CG11_big_fil_rev_8_21_14_0_20_47_16]|nr:MAG: hypothetical protein COV45_06715 [Deltaproteobacteria bacterium CG11_big_fil_rev_8_21_14_0_20_47_16]